MSWLGSYLTGLIGACMIAAIARKLLSLSKHFSGIGNVIVGLFMVFSILSPLMDMKWNEAFPAIAAGDFSQVSEQAQFYQQQYLSESIKQQTQSYILNKAQELDLTIQVDITLSEAYPYAPSSIVITGHASPYGKNQLSEYIEKNLGISKEAQTWTTTS